MCRILWTFLLFHGHLFLPIPYFFIPCQFPRYQTGALAPFMRWLQQAAAPPRPHAPPQQLNVPPIGHDGQHNPQPLGIFMIVFSIFVFFASQAIT